MVKRALPHQTLNYTSKGTWLVVAFAIGLFIACYHSLVMFHPEPAGCAMSYMYQSYAKLKSFDSKHSRLSSRYSLYLYRDAKYDGTVDESFKPDGIPVIFIPGNAGSYRQVRSIASLAAEIAADKQNNVTRLDFYTLDYQEDFTAFHGRTLLDQAEYANDAIKYILQLYDKENPATPHPKSVIIIGHSMGGFIARSLVALDNYVPESINTIVTLATPHLFPPLTFDIEMTEIYTRINQYWVDSFSETNVGRNPLSSIALVSIGGGKNDNMIQSDYISVSPLIPPTNGFATVSSTIPGVWTSIDHLAIVWCHQCRSALVNSLFQIVDPESTTKTKPLAERMQIFSKYFLSGFEPYMYNNGNKYFPSKSDSFVIKADNSASYFSPNFKIGDSNPSKKAYFAPIPKTSSKRPSSEVTIINNPEDGTILALCSIIDSKENAEDLSFDLDLTQSSEEMEGQYKKNYYKCSKIDTKLAKWIPYSNHHVKEPFESGYIPNEGLKSAHFYQLNGSEPDIKAADYVVAIPSKENKNMLLSINSNTRESKVDIKASLYKLLFGGVKIRILPFDIVDVSLKSSTSGLISYVASLNSKKSCERSTNSQSTFFMRQYVNEPFESKWYVNIGDSKPIYISHHGLKSPYLPVSPDSGNLHLQIFSPLFEENKANCGPVTLKIRINIWASLANFVIRYRTLLVPFAFSICSKILSLQLQHYMEKGAYISFASGIKTIASSSHLIKTVILLIGTHILSSFEFFREILHFFLFNIPFSFFSNYQIIKYRPPYVQNDMFVGESQWALWFIGPVAYIASAGFLIVLYYAIFYPISKACQYFAKKDNQPLAKRNASGLKSIDIGLALGTLIMLLLSVSIFPYTIALFTGLLYMLGIFGKATYLACKKEYILPDSDKSSPIKKNLAPASIVNFIESITMLLLISVVPVGVPIFITWIHQVIENNIFARFPSHHNIINLIPMGMAVTVCLLLSRVINEMKQQPTQNEDNKGNNNLGADLTTIMPSDSVLKVCVLMNETISILSLLFGFLQTHSIQSFAFIYIMYISFFILKKILAF